MTIHVLAVGESAKNYSVQSPCIGVNDCAKWGFEPDILLLLNTPAQFTKDRFEVIKSTKPKEVHTNSPNLWNKVFADIPVNGFNSRSWSHSNRLQKISSNYLYHSKTSPFAAISLAYNLGYYDIVLWGVDFVNHRAYSPGKDMFAHEINNYKSFCMSLNEVGVKVYLGSEGSNLNFLPVWNHTPS